MFVSLLAPYATAQSLHQDISLQGALQGAGRNTPTYADLLCIRSSP